MKLYNKTQKILVVENLQKATNFFQRTQGLIGKEKLSPNSALWITNCQSIHTFFMKYKIDVVFISKSKKVLYIISDIKPWRVTRWIWGADSVIEFASPKLSSGKIRIGDQLYVEP